jgi:hypothetical protein
MAENKIEVYQSVPLDYIGDFGLHGRSIELQMVYQGLSKLKRLDFGRLENTLNFGNVRVKSIHIPVLYLSSNPQEIERLMQIIVNLSELVGCKHLVAHPSAGSPDNIQKNLEEVVQPAVIQHGLTLLWENLPQEGRYLNEDAELREHMRQNPNNYRCFDINHSSLPSESMIEYIAKNSDIIREFHLSNRRHGEVDSHLPLFDPSGDIDAWKLLEVIRERYPSARLVIEHKGSREKKNADIDKISPFFGNTSACSEKEPWAAIEEKGYRVSDRTKKLLAAAKKRGFFVYDFHPAGRTLDPAVAIVAEIEHPRWEDHTVVDYTKGNPISLSSVRSKESEELYGFVNDIAKDEKTLLLIEGHSFSYDGSSQLLHELKPLPMSLRVVYNDSLRLLEERAGLERKRQESRKQGKIELKIGEIDLERDRYFANSIISNSKSCEFQRFMQVLGFKHLQSGIIQAEMKSRNIPYIAFGVNYNTNK